MSKQKIIILFISGLILLLVGFGLSVLLIGSKSLDQAGLIAERTANQTEAGVALSNVAVVPAYQPELAGKDSPAPIPEGTKTSSSRALVPTKPAEIIQDQNASETIKVINVTINKSISPDRIYLSKGDNVRLDITNQNSININLFNANKSQESNIQILPGEKKSVAYDTSSPGDSVLICQNCTPPAPLFIKILGGVLKKPSGATTTPVETLK